MERNYSAALDDLKARFPRVMSLDARLRAVVDVYWAHFGFDRPATVGKRGVSWCGFYRREVTDEAGQEMTLICREPKPACSPIGLGGMCGRGWIDEVAYVVRDVRVLGENYIACDPRDQSELVVAVWDVWGDSGPCWGVFDVDSYDVGSFDLSDAEGAIAMLEVAGLCDRARLQGAVRVL
ncbi:MAG: hypothetical protein U0640_01555 [Phycisphaerales bacterium]